MPHATHMPLPGFQALVLCGPGASLSTFTTKPEDFPKATIPIANRPMIWYALDYCYRMGINGSYDQCNHKLCSSKICSVGLHQILANEADLSPEIFIVTPPASAKAIADTLNVNPHLTSLPTPKPDIIAPKDLTHESGTAEILRSPEIRKAITGDFVVLPCDLVSELPGDSLLEAWMTQQNDLDGASTKVSDEYHARKGGLGVWYPTKGEQAFKGEETDFLVTSQYAAPVVPAPAHSIRSHLEQIRYSMPTDTLNDILEEEKSLALRSALLAKTGRVKLRTSYRDAHTYVFPRWVLDMVARTPELVSVSEDVVGNWAKATWQDGFGDKKLGLRAIFEGGEAHRDDDGVTNDSSAATAAARAQEPDVLSMCSTRPSHLSAMTGSTVAAGSRIDSTTGLSANATRREKLEVPAFLGYVHPARAASGTETGPGTLLRRVDNMPLLLSVSLRLAKLESVEEAGKGASPLAHASKVAHPEGVAQRSTVTRADCLLAENVRVEEKCVIKESVVGPNCVIKSGARLTRCLLMDDVVIGEKCQLTDCIVGRRAQIGKDSVLKECRVQDGNAVGAETEAKGEDIMVFEGLDEEGDFGADGDDEDGGDIVMG